MAINYTLLDDAGGQFSLLGSQVKVASALKSGVSTIGIRATDESGWSRDFSIPITIAQGGGVVPYLGLVATRGRMADTITASNKQYNSRSYHVARDDITDIQILFANWYYNRIGNKLEAGTGGTAYIEAAVEYPLGTITRLLFSGATSVTVADGANGNGAATLPTAIPKGAGFWVREYRVSAVATPYLASAVADSASNVNGEAFEFGAAVTNKVMGGTITPTDGTAPRNQAAPLAILGMTRLPSILIISDSKSRAAGDAQDASGDVGELARSLGPNFAYTSCASFGNTLAIFNGGGGHERQVALAQYATHVVSALGVNDATGGASGAVLNARLDAFWALFPGKKLIHGTITPVATSTDSFATLVNQAANANNPARVAANAYIRSKPSPLVGYFEVADAVESARDSGLWKVDGTAFKYTGDGTHETAFGYQAIKNAGGVDVAKVA